MGYSNDGIYPFDFYDNFQIINLNIPLLSDEFNSEKDLILSSLSKAIEMLNNLHDGGVENKLNNIEIDKTIIYSSDTKNIDCFLYVLGKLDNFNFEIYFMPICNKIYYKCNGFIEGDDAIKEKVLNIFLNCRSIVDNSEFSIQRFDFNDDLKYRKINFSDFFSSHLLFNYIADFINVIGKTELSHLLIFEKICRYLEYGKPQFDRYDTLWSDYFLAKELLTLGYDFKKIVIDTLTEFDKSNRMLNRKEIYKELDESFILDAMYEEYGKEMKRLPNIESLNERVENIRFAPFMNVRPVLSFEDIYRVFYTYAKETYIKCGQNNIPCKVINIPEYEKFLLIKCADVTLQLKKELIFNGSTLDDGFIFSTNNERYLLIVSHNKND